MQLKPTTAPLEPWPPLLHSGRVFLEARTSTGHTNMTAIFRHSRLAEGMFLSSLPQRAGYFIVLLLTIDGLFIGFDTLVHVFKFLELGGDWVFYERFGIETEGGFAEIFNYLKLSIVVAVLAATVLRARIMPCLIIALGFAFAGLDDGLQFHENVGEILEHRLGLSPLGGISANSVGQLLYFAAVGGAFSLAFVIGWFLTGTDGRRIFLVFVPMFGALAFFAVVLDGLSDAFSNSVILYNLLGLIEDGGEMLVVTVACGVALGIFHHFVPQSSEAAQYAP